jgi:GDP-mannose 6-dehydrogenase
MVALIEQLLGKGLDLHIYDRDVSESRLMGANREYIEREIPHIWTLIRPSIPEVLSRADTIVVGNGSAEFRSVRDHLRADQILIDLVRAFGAVPAGDPRYQGIAW